MTNFLSPDLDWVKSKLVTCTCVLVSKPKHAYLLEKLVHMVISQCLLAVETKANSNIRQELNQTSVLSVEGHCSAGFLVGHYPFSSVIHQRVWYGSLTE